MSESKIREGVAAELTELELGGLDKVSQEAPTKEKVLLVIKDQTTWTSTEKGKAQIRTSNCPGCLRHWTIGPGRAQVRAVITPGRRRDFLL